MDIKVEKIIIKVNDTSLALTVEEARVLRNTLNDMFGSIFTYPIYPTYPLHGIGEPTSGTGTGIEYTGYMVQLASGGMI